MHYVLTLLEGVISFISPCMLPMLPLYVSYFAGETPRPKRTFFRAVAFVGGFTVVFCALGVFAGALGGLLVRYRTAVNLVCGGLVVLLGLSYLEIVPLRFFKGLSAARRVTGIWSAVAFGMVYAVSLTPCVGAFLGSALLLAASAGTVATGLTLLLVYSLGLGIPFVLSALLLDRLKGTFLWIKTHYRVINTVCGGFLIVLGLLLMTSLFDRFAALFS